VKDALGLDPPIERSVIWVNHWSFSEVEAKSISGVSAITDSATDHPLIADLLVTDGSSGFSVGMHKGVRP
jgi:hypothetical protein